MNELPKYIKDRLSFDTSEIEMLVRSICLQSETMKVADKFICSRITYYEIMDSERGLDDFERDSYRDWIEIEDYFMRHKNSFERQYFKNKQW